MIGERIHFIRNLRGMTQEYLGISAGFPEKTSDVRILKPEDKPGTNVSTIEKNLDGDEEKGAFYCEYELFKKIYSLKRRECLRTHYEIQLVLLTMVPSAGRASHPAPTAAEKMSETIAAALRKGDIFTRFNFTQFLLLLQFTSVENGKRAIDRICRKFQIAMPRSGYLLQYNLLTFPSTEKAEGAVLAAEVPCAPQILDHERREEKIGPFGAENPYEKA